MNVLTEILSWIVTLISIVVAYVAVREVERVLVRRSFSLLLTLILVIITSGLLLNGLVPLTSNLFDQYFYGDLVDRWPALFGIAVAIGAMVLIGRDVAQRVQRGTCAQCNSPLLGHVVCPSCGWGGLELPGGMMGLVGRATSAMSSPLAARPAASGGAPTMVGTPPTGPAAPGTQAAQFCAHCGQSIAAGQAFCAHCGHTTA